MAAVDHRPEASETIQFARLLIRCTLEAEMTAMNANPPCLAVHFDAEEDILYVSRGPAECGHVDIDSDGLVLRREAAGDAPNGVTAPGFRENWLDRRSAFCSAVAEYLHFSAEDIEPLVESAIAAKG
jgi:hypothetical protein